VISQMVLTQLISSSTRPGGAFVAVPYRSYWFCSDDRDQRSKAIFSFLIFMFALMETGGKEGVPIVTIPAG
jgi:hypothetical protein